MLWKNGIHHSIISIINVTINQSTVIVPESKKANIYHIFKGYGLVFLPLQSFKSLCLKGVWFFCKFCPHGICCVSGRFQRVETADIKLIFGLFLKSPHVLLWGLFAYCFTVLSLTSALGTWWDLHGENHMFRRQNSSIT